MVLSISQNLTKNFWHQYLKATQYNSKKLKIFELLWGNEKFPNNFDKLELKSRKIGYIIATCSPMTRAHLALAKQAADNMNLDYVFFIIWPFHYIHGFHNAPLYDWIEMKKHLCWKSRFEIIRASIAEYGDSRIVAFEKSKEWYIESENKFNPDDPYDYFWTGTWYIIHKLQCKMCQYFNVHLDFFFIVGMDQYNPNIDYLIFSGGKEQVWKDYSIAHQLAIHNIYTIPRKLDGFKDIEEFVEPFGVANRVFIGKALEEEYFSATKVRENRLDDMKLEDFVMKSAAMIIKQNNYWGYSS